MKTIVASLLLMLTLIPGVFAQESQPDGNTEFRTLIGNSPSSLGGYISFAMGNTSLNGHNALMGQMRLAARIDHSLSIGVIGTGFSDFFHGLNYDRKANIPEGYYIEGGYGGIFIEPVFAPHFPVHFSFPLMVGAGAVMLTEDTYGYDWNDWEYQSDRQIIEIAPFVIVEPGVELEINLARYVRLSAGVSYKFTNSIQLDAGKEHLMNGLSVNGGIKLGVF